jgi:lipopolysaccharide export system protein LptA
LLWAGGAQAQDTAPQEQPLTISAEQTLEWHRDSKKYIARGNAVAAQGDVSIAAQSLTADYREGKESSMEIYRLTAEENVEIASQGNIATGQKAVYEVDSGKAVMTGDNLRLQSPDQIVTARERFEYDVTGGRLSAHGNAMVVRGQDNLSADMVAAVFAEDPVTKKRVLKELSAEGNVVIKTPTETVRGRSGVYDAASNIAVLRGNVRIERGPNVLEGAQAEVNLNTNVSRMIGGPEGQSGGRVRGVFYPGSKDGGAVAPVTEEAPVVPRGVTPEAPIKLIPPRPRMTAP